MAYKELNIDNLIEIDSVSSFISQIQTLRESSDGASTELYFRGQEVEFWDIEPSIFRNDMLSVEHKLMQIPLQKIPMEFKELHATFDIMTKYQHYGMCTRLLDLTTNPLVALYFACKIHGDETYDLDEGQVKREPYGVIYYTNNYPVQSKCKEVEIVSTMATYDLSRENTINNILDKLFQDKIINEETKSRWLQNESIEEFIDLIQKNYMVIPTYTNERLRRQSGIFLLAGLYSINSDSNIKNSVITKTKENLRDEFAEPFFYIRGENKEAILEELDLYNINEATLFPELEHQLNYIRYINMQQVQAVSDFSKYEKREKSNQEDLNLDNNKLNKYLNDNLEIRLKRIVDSRDLDEIKSIIQNNLVIDWYKRDSALSKMRREIMGYYFIQTENREKSRKKANSIVNVLKDVVKEFAESNVESGD